jgi:periplasmic divalent cation tolerance protein
LAGCVSKFPVESVFKWQSGIEHSAEILLVVKTRTSLSDLIIKRVKEIHSYDVPEIIVLPVAGGSAEYLKWIESETLS